MLTSRSRQAGDVPFGAHLIAQTGHAAPALPVADGADLPPMLPIVLSRLDDDQADAVVTIDLSGKSDMADALVIASGRNQRHVGAIADKLTRDLKDAGYGNVPVEGLPACDWVLIDGGDVVVHLFRPEVRDFYKLERMWAPENFPADSEVAEDVVGAPDTHAGTDDVLTG